MQCLRGEDGDESVPVALDGQGVKGFAPIRDSTACLPAPTYEKTRAASNKLELKSNSAAASVR